MVQYTNVGGYPYREETDEPALDIASQDLAESLQQTTGPTYATTAARDTAYTALIAAGKTGMRCWVTAGSGGGYADGCVWTGTEWRWDRPVPLWYTSSPMGASFALNNTAFGGYAPTSYTFTPTRSGFANVGFIADAQEVTAGWLEIYYRPRLGGGLLLPGGDVTSGGLAPTVRTKTDTTYVIPVWLSKSVPVTLAMDVACANATGSWKFNDFHWKIVQF